MAKWDKGIIGSLEATDYKDPAAICYGFEPGVAQRLNPESRFMEDCSPALRSNPGDNQTSVVIGVDCYNASLTGNKAKPITSAATDKDHVPCVISFEGNGSRPSHNGSGMSKDDAMFTLNTRETHAVWLENHPNDSRMKIAEKCETLSGRMGTGGNNTPMVLTSVVRRITPLECERLQAFPDGWTDIGEWTDSKGKKHKLADSPRYKALGNAIALPFWRWLAKRIVAQCDTPTTMASLFDGIGGFPLVFQEAGCKPIWASEVEDFCIAVTKIRFPEEETK